MGGSPAHERHMLANLASALFEHGRITTTEAKAKRLRPYAEHLITFGKRGDLHARRQVLKRLTDKSVVHTLFADIGPRYADRPGGYTRILKLGNRKGDNAPMAIIELVEGQTIAQSAVGEAERARGTRTAPARPVTGATRESAEALAAQSPTAAAVAASPAEDVPVDQSGAPEASTPDAPTTDAPAAGSTVTVASATPADDTDVVVDQSGETAATPVAQDADVVVDQSGEAASTPAAQDADVVVEQSGETAATSTGTAEVAPEAIEELHEAVEEIDEAVHELSEAEQELADAKARLAAAEAAAAEDESK